MEIEQDPAYQQMINGELYLESKPLVNLRNDVRTKLMEYNLIADNDQRNTKIKSLMKSVGNRFFVEPTIYFSYGVNITIGDHFYANHDVMLCDEGKITIGNDVKFGPKVGLYTPKHPMDQLFVVLKPKELPQLQSETMFGSEAAQVFFQE